MQEKHFPQKMSIGDVYALTASKWNISIKKTEEELTKTS
jgi:hypothetical protein